MTYKKNVNVYAYSELSEKAKGRAQNNYYENFYFEPFCVYDLADIKATATEWDAYRRTAKVEPLKNHRRKDVIAAVAALSDGENFSFLAKEAKTILAKMDRLDRLDSLWARAWRNLERQNALGETHTDLENDIERDVDSFFSDINHAVGKEIAEDYDYQTSEEYIAEHYEANDALFLMNGDYAFMFCLEDTPTTQTCL